MLRSLKDWFRAPDPGLRDTSTIPVEVVLHPAEVIPPRPGYDNPRSVGTQYSRESDIPFALYVPTGRTTFNRL